jgi:hypothetical protein
MGFHLALFIRVSSVFNMWQHLFPKTIMPTDLIHRIGVTAPAKPS